MAFTDARTNLYPNNLQNEQEIITLTQLLHPIFVEECRIFSYVVCRGQSISIHNTQTKLKPSEASYVKHNADAP